MNKVNIQAIKVPEGKTQHMKVGMVYSVGENTAQILIKKKRAVEATKDMIPGKVYDVNEKEAKKRNVRSIRNKTEQKSNLSFGFKKNKNK